MGQGWKRFKRQYIQLLSAVLYNCNWKGFAEGRIYQGNTKGLCVPGLNCYSCPGATMACPLGSLQTALVSSRYRFPNYVLGTILLLGLCLGRLICGMLCPFGFLQELLHKLPTPKIKKNKVTRALSLLKYGIILVFVLFIPVVMAEPGFCKYLCPAGTLEAGIPVTILQSSLRSMIGGLFTWKVLVLILLLILCVFCYRAFCRFLCPLGAIYSLLNPVSFFGIKVDQSKCIHCGKCVQTCRLDVRRVCDRECVQCGECISRCPVSAIHYGWREKCPEEKESKKQEQKTRKVLSQKQGRRYIVLSFLLIGAIALLVWGGLDGGFNDIKNKAIRICYECMGIG